MSKPTRAFIVSFIYKSNPDDIGYSYGHTIIEHTSLLPMALIRKQVENTTKTKHYVITSVSEIEPLDGCSQPEKLIIAD